MLGECNHFIPSTVFFNLRADDDCGDLAGIERANDFVESRRIRQNSLRDFAHGYDLAVVHPVVHRNGDEHRTHGRLNCEVIRARDCRWHILGPKGFVRPFHVGLDQFDSATYEKWFCQDMAAILLSRRHDKWGVAIECVNQC